MLQLINPLLNKTAEFLSNTKAGILPFTEVPPRQVEETIKVKGTKSITASDLFSFFTADIIREEVIFTR